MYCGIFKKMCCTPLSAIKLLNDLKVKVRTEFPNVWGEYKYHSNPYIQGTTVPCDICEAHMTSLYIVCYKQCI